MSNTPNGWQRKNGDILPYRQFIQIMPGFSIAPLKTTFWLRNDKTGEIVKPGRNRPAAHDSLMMALYTGNPPLGYIAFCFGHQALGDTVQA